MRTLLALCVTLLHAPVALAGVPERVGGRGELFDLLSSLQGPQGRAPEVWFEVEADARALRFLLETALAEDGRRVATVVDAGFASAPCRVALSRDADLTWVVRREGQCVRRQVVAPAAPVDSGGAGVRLPWAGLSAGPAVGNRGAGGTLRISGGLGWDQGQVGLELGARGWGAAEVVPDLRVAGGIDALFRAGDGGFVELGAGLAGLHERAQRCSDCAPEAVSAFGPSVSGAVGLRGPIAGGALEGVASLHGRSLPQRRFAVALTLGVVSRRQAR